MRASLLLVITVAILGLVPSIALSDDGPFGLTWGMSKDQVKELGVSQETAAAKLNLEVFATTSLPRNLSIAEKYELVFDKRFGLQKVQMVSKDITDDLLGVEGKKVYANLKESLTKKYGKPSHEIEFVGAKLWEEADEFYQCLAYSGCGAWAAGYEHETGTILVQLEGMDRGRGFIRLTYEGPRWAEALNEMRSHEAAADDDAL